MKNVHRYNNDSSFIAEYGGSGYSEPWVSVADNVTLVDSFTATSSNEAYTDRFTFVKRLPIGKFNVIIPNNNPPSHIDYVYLWKWNREWTGGGGLAKGSTNSSNDKIAVTLTADFSNTNVSTNVDIYSYGNPYVIHYIDTYEYGSISDVTTKTISNLAYAKRIGNIENHMEFDLADYEASNYRVPVTADFSPFSDTGGDVPVVEKSSNGSSSDICCFLVTFMDNNVERQCFGTIDYNYVYLSDYDINGDLIDFRNRFFPYIGLYYTKNDDQWYLYSGAPISY